MAAVPLGSSITRAGFLGSLAAVIAAPAGAEALPLPVVLEGGRFFAVPRVARDGAVMKLWLDTDGGGFLFSESVVRWGLSVLDDPNGGKAKWTRLPEFVAGASVPAPLGREGRLVIFERDADDRRDPILQGFDGQLGASWFQDRAWTFDYRAGRVTVRDAIGSGDGAQIPVSFVTGRDGNRLDGRQVPRVTVSVGDVTHTMSFDTAATVALSASGLRRFDDGLPAVRATSFVRRAVFDAWRAAHRDWVAFDEVSVFAHIAAVRVPAVKVGGVDLGPVWFSTRPGDDVFGGDASLDGKLGANAFANRVVSVDYPRGVLALR